MPATKEERRESYAEKIEAKRERFADRADKAHAESSAAHAESRRIGSMIPMGQPILVGHHSEKSHRRDLARIDSKMRQAIDADGKAAHYAHKAESYGTHGISSDNPDAIDLLRDKLARIEAERHSYKTANKVLRAAHNKAKKANGGAEIVTVGAWLELIAVLDVSEEIREQFKRSLGFSASYGFVKFGYQITNLGTNIRTVKKRIAALESEEKRAEEPAQAIEHEGFRIEECPDDNRIRFYFDSKPSAEIRKTMKSNGFRWSPKAGAWQRHLNNAGRWAASYAAGRVSTLLAAS